MVSRLTPACSAPSVTVNQIFIGSSARAPVQGCSELLGFAFAPNAPFSALGKRSADEGDVPTSRPLGAIVRAVWATISVTVYFPTEGHRTARDWGRESF